MIRNYLKVAWRNLMKSKVFSLINILGLTIGITVCLMIALYVVHEFSFDNFHANAKNIYRVNRQFPGDEGLRTVPWLSGPYGPALKNDFGSAINRAVRVNPSDGLVSFGEKAFNEKRIFAVDSDFFQLFSFPLIAGDPNSLLQQPNSVVLTEGTAKKYFGDIKNAMGKTIELDKELVLTVTGIAEDVPSNSHLKFDLIFPISNYDQYPFFHTWMNNGLYTYIELNENVKPATLEKQFPAFLEKHMGEDMKQSGIKPSLSLTKLTDIYFEPTLSFDARRSGDKSVIYIFLSVALLILLIACINFSNLATIRAVERSKEVGLRKVLGALRGHLVWQFIGETILLTTISCILSLVLLQLFMPAYDMFLGYNLSFTQNAGYIALFLLLIIFFIGVLAGIYPAIFLSAFKPIETLKGKLRIGKGGSNFRNALVVIQFSISIFLIIGTIMIGKQMSYVKNKQLGYQQEQALVVPLNNSEIRQNRNLFKEGLLANNNIVNVSMMSGEPGGFFDRYSFEAEDQPDTWSARTVFTDMNYVNTLGLKIIAGRDFTSQLSGDSLGAAIINRTAAASLGYTPEQALGKWVKNMMRDSLKRRIVGVVEDFNFLSLKQKMDPLVISPGNDRRVALIKITPGNLAAALGLIKKEYNQLAPVYPFEYSFLDEKFDEMYKNDLRQQKLLSIFTGLAIFIACLGLFGLASFTATKRTKEIGVRKVIGSSVQNIVLLLSKDLLKPVLISALIAMPAGFYFMNKWLQNFAYRTALSWWVLVLAAAITMLIALMAVGLKALKAAMANPVNSLRSE